jgi:hypothetical protein
MDGPLSFAFGHFSFLGQGRMDNLRKSHTVTISSARSCMVAPMAGGEWQEGTGTISEMLLLATEAL